MNPGAWVVHLNAHTIDKTDRERQVKKRRLNEYSTTTFINFGSLGKTLVSIQLKM